MTRSGESLNQTTRSRDTGGPFRAPSVAIVLAAGAGRRFGGDKQFARLADGRSLLRTTVDHVLDAVDRIIVVTRPDLERRVREEIPLPARRGVILTCPDADRGMGHSLACAVARLDADPDGCLICLGDMPWVQPDTCARLRDALRPDSIVVPHYRNTPGHPVGFGRRFFAALRQCHGDRGARDVIRQHPEARVALDVDDPGILRDVDTPADLNGPPDTT